MTRAEQKKKRRTEILDAGLELFLRKGFAATKIQDIAQHVGMSVGLLFNYFDSKEVLYEELIRIGVSGPRSVIPTPNIKPIIYFETVTESLLDAVKTEPITAKMFVFMNQAMRNDSVSPDIRKLLNQMDNITPSIPLIRAGQKDKTIKDGDPYALSIAFWSSINGIAEMVALLPDAPCPEPGWVIDIIRRTN